MWTEWVEKTYDEQHAQMVAARLGMEAVTLPENDVEASTAAAGGGGSGEPEFCGLTGCALVDIAAAAVAASPAGP